MKKKSNIGFWIKNAVIMIAVIAGATTFLLYGPKPPSDNSSDRSVSNDEAKGVSAGVTRFYSNFRQTSRDPIKEIYGEDTIILEDNNNETVGSKLEAMPQARYHGTSNWDGSYKERAFRQYSTIKNEATEYASQEGFNLVWDLKQDFKIRNRFTITGTLVESLEEIAGAVDSHFHHPILIYFCDQQRAIVVTERESAYLTVNCQKSQGSYQNY